MVGQSRILISIATNICSSQISNNNEEEIKQSREGEELVFIHRAAFFSADSTLREVMDYIMVQHSLVVVRDTECKFFDCTAYPPKELIFNTGNDQLIGPNSVTLQSLGWFPSGTIVVTHTKDHSAHYTILNVSKISTLELGTFQDAPSVDYGGAIQNPNIKTNNFAKLLPTQIFTDVAQRFHSHGDEEQQQITTIHFRNQKKKEEAMQEQLKQNQKLLTMIKQLEDKQQNKKKGSSKQTNITSQVRKMLIKSRSVGDNENLRQADRFFLEVIVITQCDDSLENNSSTYVADSLYCFFSKMDTVGKVASSCSSKVTTAQTTTSLGGTATRTSKTSSTPSWLEFLVPKPTDAKESDTNDDNNYNDEVTTLCRVPNTMTLLDCQRHGILQNFERIIIRRYYGNNVDFAAPCIMEGPKIGGSYSSTEVSDDTALKNVVQECDTSNLNSSQDGNSNSFNNYSVSNEEEERIIRYEKAVSHIISSPHSASTTCGKNATRRNTNTIEKVRQMQMKSKAQGNKRLIPEEDRYYLQIIHFYDDDTYKNNTMHSACHFFSMQRSKAIDVIACCNSGVDSTIHSSELLIRTDKPRVYYYKLPDDMTLKEAEKKGFLKQFSQVFIRSFKKI